MIFGIGVDCVNVERIAKSMQREHFVQRVFSAGEQAHIKSLASDAQMRQTAAANFAAKEAFLKAAGVGLGGFALSDVAALRKKSGAPYYELFGSAAEFLAQNNLSAHLSLTHEGGIATAFAVLEKCT